MTQSDFLYLLLFSFAILLVVVLAEVFRRKMNWSSNVTRKIVHMTVGILVALTPFVLTSMWPMVILGTAFTVYDYFAIRKHWLEGMHGVKRRTYGTVFYPISFVILTVSLWNHHKLVLVTAMLIMALSDALAAVVGENVKKPLVMHFGPEKKSLQGSATMFLTTLLITYICFSFAVYMGYYGFSFGYQLWVAIVIAMLATASEAVSAKGSDNLTVPLLSALGMFYMITEPVSEVMLFSFGMLLSLLVGWLSYKAKFLTAGGSIALFILGTIVFGIGRIAFAIPILAFFVLSSLLSKMGKKRKEMLNSIFEKSGCRDAGQVLANGGVAGIIVILWYIFKVDSFYILYIASLAAVTADTWGTEIGVMAKTAPRSILTFKTVPMGTSGGVTLLGTFGAAVGALLLAAFGFFFSPHHSPSVMTFSGVIIVIIAGILAGLVDSILGATIQAQFQCPNCDKITEKKSHCDGYKTKFISGYKWVNNDTVNALCSASGVIFAWLLLILLNL